jgi:hypothetical protein
MDEQDGSDEKIQSNRVTEVFALLFVAIVMLLLFVKILFF